MLNPNIATIQAAAGPFPTPSKAQLAYAMDQARAAVQDRAAPGWLRAYYQPNGSYAGNTFLTVEPNDPWQITSSDLFAISLLNVKVGPREARRVLESPTNQQASSALQGIPVDADLTTASDEVWRAAERFYWLLKPLLGTNAWVTRSKLCARKRPPFFPVRDSVVTVKRLRLGTSPVTDWAAYKHLITDQAIQDGLKKVTHEVTNHSSEGLEIVDPPLKVLDVLLWMSKLEKVQSINEKVTAP